MEKILGIGIIGGGVISRYHAKAYQALSDRARIVGMADVDPRKSAAAAEQFFIPVTCTDYQQLLQRDDIDLVSICTPPFLHEEMVVAALRAGKYVVCEKPLAHSLRSADRIIDAAREYPGKLTTVFQLRYQPEFQRMIWLRDQGQLGDLLAGHLIRFSKLAGSDAASGGWWGRWEVAGGGVVMTQFIHHLDQICTLFGRPTEVFAEIDTVAAPIESEDTFAATIRFENGALVSCCSSVAAQRFQWRMDVFGRQMSVHHPWAMVSHDARLRRKAAGELKAAMPGTKRPGRGLVSRVVRQVRHRMGWIDPAKDLAGAWEHLALLRDVVDAIRDARPLPIGPEEARLPLELCTAIYASALSGTKVTLPLDVDSPYYQGIAREDYQNRQAQVTEGRDHGS